VTATVIGSLSPATSVSMLGSIAGSADHETWAYGFTSAPPASVGGARLPYTARSRSCRPERSVRTATRCSSRARWCHPARHGSS
jgi:hypothetical protein